MDKEGLCFEILAVIRLHEACNRYMLVQHDWKVRLFETCLLRFSSPGGDADAGSRGRGGVHQREPPIGQHQRPFHEREGAHQDAPGAV